MLKLSFTNVTRHKVRAILSIFGIMLGVASLIALVSVVDGIRFQIEDAFSKAQGARVAPIKATDPIFSQLDGKWVSKVAKVQGVKVAIPVIIQAAKNIDGKDLSPFNAVRVLGIDLSAQSKATGSGFTGELLEGRDFKASDRGVVLIGKKIKEDYDKFLGTNIRIDGEQFKVVGIYTTGSDLLDNSIEMSIEDERDTFSFPQGKISYINVQFTNPGQVQSVVDRINAIYGEEIKATSLSDFSSQFGELFDSITALVVVIASIASLVAAVGIINTMLMNVLERFREIGALKAVGWTNGNVVAMILYESLFVGVFGGISGVVLGVLTTGFMQGFGLTTVVSPSLIVGSFLGAVAVGIAGGIYPAFMASKMDPVDALRAE
ncbi:MAG: ABC transporter permease [Candidatus Diapherotrites archaeon]|uniref:ABC transporter permease n=1 Tax=Candidatus Iainarchaeum sp. TaxID=3101447 RepID=A0A8T3YJI4_9ARCH|nr:ABC transporter permease [Candidatus Diapherotrites archaeon]